MIYNVTSSTITIKWEAIDFGPQLAWNATCTLLCDTTTPLVVGANQSVLSSSSLSLTGLPASSECNITISGFWPQGFVTEPLVGATSTESSSEPTDVLHTYVYIQHSC